MPPFSLSLSRLTRGFLHDGKDLWKVALAIVAVADLCGCWPVLVEGWRQATAATTSTHSQGFSAAEKMDFLKKAPENDENDKNDESFCWNGYYDYDYYYGHWKEIMFTLIGPLFCTLCIIEAVIRAKQARRHVLEMEALDDFEQKLASLYGSTRWGSRSRPAFHTEQEEEEEEIEQTEQSEIQENDHDQQQQQKEIQEAHLQQSQQVARSALRFWTPVITTLAFWFVLMPWRSLLHLMMNMITMTYSQQERTIVAVAALPCGKDADTALATHWIQLALQHTAANLAILHALAIHRLWKLAMPFQFWQTRQFIKRAKLILRWVRYIRFSGPLGRIAFKLNDQFWVFYNTRYQTYQAKYEKEKRVRRRSMLFEDIQRIESLVKLQTRLAKVPSQMFTLAQSLTHTHTAQTHTHTVQAEHIQDALHKHKQQGMQVKAQLQQLKSQIQRNSQAFPTSDLYDKVVALSQELTTTLQANSNRLWNAHLISPQTRFSVGWRLIVTVALLSELTRICTSYQLYGRVNVSFTDMMKAVLGCESSVNNNLLTAYGRLARKLFKKVLHVKPSQKQCTALTSHSIAKILLTLTGAFEASVDLVCFLDIFVWFLTGELDGATGIVVPKPFFYRCIIPGTLVQVLDHPTLPHVLPNLLAWSLAAAEAVGYSRFLRWILAIVPVFDLLLQMPFWQSFLFKPMEEEEWLRYTESLAIIPAISGADIRYAMSHQNLLKRAEPSLHLFPSTGESARTYYHTLSKGAKQSNQHMNSMKHGEPSMDDLYFPFASNSSTHNLRHRGGATATGRSSSSLRHPKQQIMQQRVGMDLSDHNISDTAAADNSIYNPNIKRSSSRWTLHPLEESYSFSYGNFNY